MQDHKPGSLVLVRNVPLENTMPIKRKTASWYIGPYQVVEHTKGNSYKIQELNGTELKNPIAAFRLIPYLKQEELGKSKRQMEKQRMLVQKKTVSMPM